MSDNPWQGPEAPAQAEEHAAQGVLTALMIRYLKEASPWLRFIGVLGYISVGFLVLAGIIMMATAGISGAAAAGPLGALSGLAGIIYVPIGALAFFPARFTHRFGSKIRHYLQSGAERDLEEALKNNRSLWKFSGIVAIVYLSFIPVGIIVAVVVALVSLVG
jgi:uncharacterized membrane protein SirB2